MAKVHKKTGENYLLCPRCGVNMRKIVKNDVVLDVCDKCKGMWVDHGELDKLSEIAKNQRTK